MAAFKKGSLVRFTMGRGKFIGKILFIFEDSARVERIEKDKKHPGHGKHYIRRLSCLKPAKG